MHNLVNKDFEKLDICSKEQVSGKYRDYWGSSGCQNHRVRGHFPGQTAKRIIKLYENKTFDQAFAHYCRLVPKYQQAAFIEEFALPIDRRWRYREYEVVDGIIKKIVREENKRIWTYYSDDYKIGYQHKITNEVISESDWYNIRDGYWGYSKYGTKRKDYDKIIVTGWSKNFESPKDPRYIKLKREQAMRKKVAKRKLIKAKRDRCYIFLTKDELQKKFDTMESILIRDRHGFDKTTFMGIEYHGQKRKLKE